MGYRYSYSDFTTKGHGVIEYADSYPGDSGKKSKRRSKIKSKYATRWPGPAPMKFKSSSSEAVSSKTVEQKAQKIFKKRFPGQQPKKGQIKEIIRELRKSGSKFRNQEAHKKVKKNSSVRHAKNNPVTEIDERVLAVYSRRFPGEKPQADQLKEIREEVINARKRLGL